MAGNTFTPQVVPVCFIWGKKILNSRRLSKIPSFSVNFFVFQKKNTTDNSQNKILEQRIELLPVLYRLIPELQEDVFARFFWQVQLVTELDWRFDSQWTGLRRRLDAYRNHTNIRIKRVIF